MSFIGGWLSSKTEPEDIKDFVKSPGLSQDNPFTQDFNKDAAANQALAGQMNGFANNGAQAQTAAQQQDYINALRAQANGQGPSVAQAMMNNSLQQNVANTNALAASAKGNSNPILAQRMAMQQNSQSAQQAAQMGAVGRMQEQLNAQGQLGGALANMRNQDMQNSGLFNNLGLNYNNLALQNKGAGLSASNANLTQDMNAKNINASIATGNTAAQNAATQTVVGGVLSGGAKVGAAIATGAHTGGVVPGKATVKGDSIQNDKVPMALSPGEIVIPKTMSSDAEKAKAFVEHLLGSKGKSSDKTGYAKVLEAQRTLKSIEQRLKKIETKVGKH
jgi:hypothetical protein